jgi:hypothetical protein
MATWPHPGKRTGVVTAQHCGGLGEQGRELAHLTESNRSQMKLRLFFLFFW